MDDMQIMTIAVHLGHHHIATLGMERLPVPEAYVLQHKLRFMDEHDEEERIPCSVALNIPKAASDEARFLLWRLQTGRPIHASIVLVFDGEDWVEGEISYTPYRRTDGRTVFEFYTNKENALVLLEWSLRMGSLLKQHDEFEWTRVPLSDAQMENEDDNSETD